MAEHTQPKAFHDFGGEKCPLCEYNGPALCGQNIAAHDQITILKSRVAELEKSYRHNFEAYGESDASPVHQAIACDWIYWDYEFPDLRNP
jgi:hypothetical protein